MSTSSLPAILRDVVWHSLGEGHAALAQTADGARRYQPAYAPFAALATYDDASFDVLAGLMAPGEEVVFFTVGDVEPTARFEVLMRKHIHQMVGPATPLQAPAMLRSVPLGPDDVPAMRALVEVTKPGPFRELGHTLGNFIGIKVDGRLVAMAGERLHLHRFRELSAVCTSPEFRGQGHARELIQTLAAAISARGQTPFLHVFTDNHSAIALYRQLGFTPSHAFRVTVLRRV